MNYEQRISTNQERKKLRLQISATSFIVAFTLVLVLLAVGLALFLFPHLSTPAEIALAQEILAPSKSYLLPKPEIRLAFVVFTLALPIAALLSAAVIGRITLSEQLTAFDFLLFFAALLAIFFTLAKESLLPSARFSGGTTLIIAAIAVLCSIPMNRVEFANKKHTRWIVVSLLCLAAIGLTFALRVFGASEKTAEGAHLGAYLYSINQIKLGGTCLVDTFTQYGCYGELYRPIFSLVELNVANLTLVNAALQSIALVSAIVFSSFIIKRPAILACTVAWFILCIFRIDAGNYDAYYQYTPLRFFFPALSLVVAIAWCKYPGIFLAVISGIFSAAAIFSNLDSGAVVAVALGALVLFAGSTHAKRSLFKRVGHFSAYWAAAFFCLLWIQAAISVRANAIVNLTDLALYAKIFAGSGFMMLPTPGLPSIWGAAALIAVASGGIFAIRMVSGQASTRDHLTAYITILGIGLFSYYLGRSHPWVLMLCIWPFIILGFSLLDQLQDAKGTWGKRLQFTSTVTVFFFAIAAGLAIVRVSPEITKASAIRWSQLLHQNSFSNVWKDLAFIRSHTPPGESFEVLAQHQATLYVELKKRSTLPGPGIAEILLKTDANRLIEMLTLHGPDNLFVERELLERQSANMNTSAWLEAALPKLREVYALKEWGGESRWLHLVRKPYGGPDLFDVNYTCGSAGVRDSGAICYVYDKQSGVMRGPNGRAFRLPFDLLSTSPAGRFRIGLVVVPHTAEKAYSTIISNHCCEFSGFVIHALPTGAGLYSLSVGDGSKWVASNAFQLRPGRRNSIILDYKDGNTVVLLDEIEVASVKASMQAPEVGLTLGDWFARTRPFFGHIEEAWYKSY